MWMIAGAVLSASVLGSLHCAGMCGPLAMWASGMERQQHRWKTQTATALYHLGRLVTYSLVGAIAGSIGGLLDASGRVLGFQLLAAQVVGVFMIAVGLREAWKQVRIRFPRFAQRLWPQRWPKHDRPSLANTKASQSTSLAGFLARLRPQIFRLPLPLRGLLTGLLTALLPCGWLYMFALVAAGTGTVTMGAVVMAAFWLGTVPILVALVTGLHGAAPKLRSWLPLVASLLLVSTGLFTFSGRGFAQLHSLDDIVARSPDRVPTIVSKSSIGVERNGTEAKQNASESSANVYEAVARVREQKLPCCSHEK